MGYTSPTVNAALAAAIAATDRGLQGDAECWETGLRQCFGQLFRAEPGRYPQTAICGVLIDEGRRIHLANGRINGGDLGHWRDQLNAVFHAFSNATGSAMYWQHCARDTAPAI